MSHYEATLQQLSCRINPNAALLIKAPLFVTRPIDQRPPCWDVYDKTAMIDTIVRNWICPPIYTIMHIDDDEIDETSEYGEEHVFDGAHKVEAGCEFMDGKFKITYNTKDLPHGILKVYQGKCYKELPKDLRQRISDYKFTINKIDEETAKDEDALHILWMRLNCAGKTLNEYELCIPIISSLIESVLKPNRKIFMETVVFPYKESHRGQIEIVQQLLLALSEPACTKIKSIADTIREWQKKLGDTAETRETHVRKNAEEWSNKLKHMHKIMSELHELNAFRHDNGESILEKHHVDAELPIVLGIIARKYNRIEDFRSQKKLIAECLKREVFGLKRAELFKKCDVNRSGRVYLTRFLQRTITLIENIGESLQPRQFTSQQIKAALKKQQDVCTWCSKPILPDHARDGDHVIPWSQGGETTAENLEVLHRHCHHEKTAGLEHPVAV